MYRERDPVWGGGGRQDLQIIIRGGISTSQVDTHHYRSVIVVPPDRLGARLGPERDVDDVRFRPVAEEVDILDLPGPHCPTDVNGDSLVQNACLHLLHNILVEESVFVLGVNSVQDQDYVISGDAPREETAQASVQVHFVTVHNDCICGNQKPFSPRSLHIVSLTDLKNVTNIPFQEYFFMRY